MHDREQQLLLIASSDELPPSQRIWGTGGWLPPEEREALDWLTFSRLSGWGVEVQYLDFPRRGDLRTDSFQWIVLACDPGKLNEEMLLQLEWFTRNNEVLVVARAASNDTPFAKWCRIGRSERSVSGKSLRWSGPRPHREWTCRNRVIAEVLDLPSGSECWATLEGQPIVGARRVGRGWVASLGFHPSRLRDADGAATCLLRQLLVCGSPRPVAWLDFADALVLRMDDPGGAQNVHCEQFAYAKLDEPQWRAVAKMLADRRARLSICYVPGWVDDGDERRGRLLVEGRTPSPRQAGAVYPSHHVKYEDVVGHMPGTLHDYQSEFRGIQSLRVAGLAEVEMHGFTHMHPDTAAWSRAEDRYRNSPPTFWFRELKDTSRAFLSGQTKEQHPLSRSVSWFLKYFGVLPSTLVCPGDDWTNEALEMALDLGITLVDSYYLALRNENRLCWTTHVCAPYLDTPDPKWFDGGLPVVGYCHDREPAIEGVSWLDWWLDAWCTAGARRFIDFRELSSAVSRRLAVRTDGGRLRLSVEADGAPEQVRPVAVQIHMPDATLPSVIDMETQTGLYALPIEPVDEQTGRVLLPAGNSAIRVTRANRE